MTQLQGSTLGLQKDEQNASGSRGFQGCKGMECCFPGATITKCQGLGGLNNRNLLCLSSGSWESEMEMRLSLRSSCQQGWFFAETQREKLVHASLPTAGSLLESVTFLGLWMHHPIWVHLHMSVSLCACLYSNHPFYKVLKNCSILVKMLRKTLFKNIATGERHWAQPPNQHKQQGIYSQWGERGGQWVEND